MPVFTDKTLFFTRLSGERGVFPDKRFIIVNLNHVQAMFTNSPSYIWEDDGSTVWYTYGWLDRVAKEGTFVKNADATWNATGANAIPSGWTVLTE